MMEDIYKQVKEVADKILTALEADEIPPIIASAAIAECLLLVLDEMRSEVAASGGIDGLLASMKTRYEDNSKITIN